MRRFGMFVLLLLSLGVNVGVLGTLGVQHFRGVEKSGPAESLRPQRAGAPPEIGRLVERLGLQGEARQKFLEIQRHFFVATREARGRLEGQRVDLRRELAAAAPDRARIDESLREIATETSALERALVANILDSREVLDDEQERMFLRFVAERMRPRRMAAGPRPGWERPGERDGEAWQELPARAPEPR